MFCLANPLNHLITLFIFAVYNHCVIKARVLVMPEHALMTSVKPYVAIGGWYFTTRHTLYPVALKPLRIVTKAFVTFPEYKWAKKLKKI